MEEKQTYMPQYKLLGVQPEEYKTTEINPRIRQPSIRTTAVLPNVVNKMEHTWSVFHHLQIVTHYHSFTTKM